MQLYYIVSKALGGLPLPACGPCLILEHNSSQLDVINYWEVLVLMNKETQSGSQDETEIHNCTYVQLLQGW